MGLSGTNVNTENRCVAYTTEYEKVLEHRGQCENWDKNKLCVDCFGGGLTKFWKKVKKRGGK
jgi:hypothetical protein